MTARSTYESSIATVPATVAASTVSAPSIPASTTHGTFETARQELINQSGCNAGYYPGKGGSGEAAFQAAVTAANQARFLQIFQKETARQSAIASAVQTLRATGDTGPA